MRKSEAEGGAFRTSEDWAEIAEQAASKTEQEFHCDCGPKGIPLLLTIGFLAFVIIFALTVLVFPQALDFQTPAKGWLYTHRLADAALGIILTVVWWGLRIGLSNSAISRSKSGTNRLTLK